MAKPIKNIDVGFFFKKIGMNHSHDVAIVWTMIIVYRDVCVNDVLPRFEILSPSP
uniref:Uncharacterized protein n=1 Tax=Human betaherpesvirus 6 TaxID=10368 RepID=A0A5P9T9I1_9BETA|nr:hypothetical protein [Human betaherpesvirus 6]